MLGPSGGHVLIVHQQQVSSKWKVTEKMGKSARKKEESDDRTAASQQASDMMMDDERIHYCMPGSLYEHRCFSH